MTEDRKNIEQIEDFLLGKLSAVDHASMIQSMEINENIRQQVIMQKLIMTKLSEYGDQELNVELDRIHEKYFGKKDRTRFIWYFLAFTGVLISAYLAYYFNTNKKIIKIENTSAVNLNNFKTKVIPIVKEAPVVPKENKLKIKNKKSEFNKFILLPEYPTSLYEKGAVIDMNRLSYFTNGKVYFSKPNGFVYILKNRISEDTIAKQEYQNKTGSSLPSKLTSAENLSVGQCIDKILSQNISDHSEVVIMMDKTQSMKDDIFEVRKSIEKIMERINTKKEVKICFSAFGDANYNSNKEWFSSSGFKSNKDSVSKYLNEISLVAGVDTPESLYDAICFQLDQFPFTAKGKRIIILLSDAAAQDGEFTVNDEASAISKCKKNKASVFSIILRPDNRK